MVVVGGGWAGAAAAVEAVRRGRRVVLVEERPYLGGRARSFVDRTTGEIIDNGQHLMMGAYHATLQTLAALGTDVHLRRQRALSVLFAVPGGHTDLLDAGRFGITGRAGVALGILALRRVSWSGRLAALRFARRVQTGRVDTHGRTCMDLLRAEGQPQDVITRFWEPIILATLNAAPDRAAASLLTTVLQRAFFGSGTDSQLLLPMHGLSVFLDPLPSYLAASGGEVVTSASADALHRDGDRVTAVTLSNGRTIDCDAVVLAVPPRALARIAGAPVVQLDDLTFSPIVSVYLWYDRPWLDHAFAALLGTTTQWVFNRRLLAQAETDVISAHPGHVALTISAGTSIVDRPSPEIITHCDAELRSVFASMHGATLQHGLVIKEKSATFLATPDIERRRPPASTSLSNVFLAGDWTNTGLPATIEGAAQSGIEAARVAM